MAAPSSPATGFQGPGDYYYSNLEVAPQPGYSTLESMHQNGDDCMEGKEIFQSDSPNPKDIDLEANNGGFWSRRLCGMSMKVTMIAGVIFLLGLVGGVVGGVIGSGKKDNSTAPDPIPTPLPGPTSSELTSATATATSTSSASSSSTTGTPRPTSFTSPFWAEDWYTLSTNDGVDYYFDATYDATAKVGSLKAKAGYDQDFPNPDQQYQIRGVPKAWENSTVLPDGWDTHTRLYWIACQSYGPEVRLALSDDTWANGESGFHQLHFHPVPENVHDSGQYFFFELAQTVDGIDRYRMYNWKSGVQFRVVFMANWGNPLLESLLPLDDARGEWVVLARAKIEKQDGNFKWFVDPSI